MSDLNSKSDFLKLAGSLVEPLLKYYDNQRSIIELPYETRASYSEEIAGFETFARSLWAMSGLVKYGYTGSRDAILGMIKNGIDPESESYWGSLEAYSQIIVELPAIMYFIWLNKSEFDNKFNEKEKKQFSNWFLQVNGVDCYQNNWLFSIIIVNAALKSLGLENNSEIVKKQWNRIDSMYVTDGWYRDGTRGPCDYYNAYAFHFYSLLWTLIDDGIDFEIKTKIYDRADRFAKQYICMFNADGGTIPYGRSLIYRFGSCSFWSMYSVCGRTAVEPTVVKGIIVRNLKYWLSKNIYRPDGLLNLGYGYQNAFVTDCYNATGSVFWAFKIFTILSASDNFWKLPSSDFPWVEDENTRTPDFEVFRYQGQSILFPIHVYALNRGTGNITSKYERFSYSSTFGFNVPRGFETMYELAPESTCAVSFDDRRIIEKSGSTDSIQDDGTIVSLWSCDNGVAVECVIVPGNPWSIRIYKIKTERCLRFYDFGFAVSTKQMSSVISDNQTELASYANRQYSAIRCLMGNGASKMYNCAPSTNVLYPSVAVPYMEWILNPGNHFIVDAIYGGCSCPNSYPDIKIQENNVSIDIGNGSGIYTYEKTFSVPDNFLMKTKFRIKRLIGR